MKTLEKHPLLKELEINNEVEISVEQRHIDQGQKNVRAGLCPNRSCAIYLAIDEYFGKTVEEVGREDIWIKDSDLIPLPYAVQQFIKTHDNLKPVKPFKFNIKL